MKKGEKKVIKNQDKPNEVVIAEKVIDTRKNNLSKDPLILEISAALFALEERQGTILEKVNKICTRLGLSKV
tara:strand:- start:203 stop:418 length:216 start_codon:yes stop_codon:yes gene_type:complete